MSAYGIIYDTPAPAPGDNPATGTRKHLLQIFNESDKNITRLPQVDNLKASTLHNEFSIVGNPATPNKPQPSRLDLDGNKPVYEYKRNLPTGARI